MHSKDTGPVNNLGPFGPIVMGVCTPWHWQTPGRLVQELNDCTVASESIGV